MEYQRNCSISSKFRPPHWKSKSQSSAKIVFYCNIARKFPFPKVHFRRRNRTKATTQNSFTASLQGVQSTSITLFDAFVLCKNKCRFAYISCASHQQKKIPFLACAWRMNPFTKCKHANRTKQKQFQAKSKHSRYFANGMNATYMETLFTSENERVGEKMELHKYQAVKREKQEKKKWQRQRWRAGKQCLCPA